MKHRRCDSRLIRLVLFAGGSVLFGLSLWCATAVPFFDSGFVRTIDPDKMQFEITRLQDSGPFRRSLYLDLKTDRQYIQEDLRDRGTVLRDDRNRRRIDYSTDSMQTKIEYSLISSDEQGNETSVPLEFTDRPHVLNEYFIASQDSHGLIKLLDLQAQRIHSIQPTNVGGAPLRLLHDPACPSLLNISNSPGSAGPVTTAELFVLGQDGVPRSVWVREVVGGQFSIRCSDGNYRLIDRKSLKIECFSAIDGSLVASQDLPGDLADRLNNPAIAPQLIEFRDTILCIHWSNKHEFYLLPSLRQIPFSDPASFAVYLKGNNHLVGIATYQNDHIQLSMIDANDMKVLWQQSRSLKLDGFEQQANSIIFTDAAFGISVDIVDSSTGQLLVHRQPFRWLAVLLPALLVCANAWAWQLVRCSGSLATNFRWVVASALWCSVAAVLLGHIIRWGYYHNPVFMHNYLQGLFVAKIAIAHAWLVWGRGTLLVRCIPLFISTATLMLLARFMLTKLDLSIEAVGTTLLVSGLTLPMFLAMRWIGFSPSSADRESTRGEPWKIPLKSLFIASSMIAVLLSASLPMLKGLKVPSSPPQAWHFAVATAILLAGMAVFTLLEFKGWRATSELISYILIACLSLEAIYEFATTSPLILSRSHLDMVIFRGLFTSLAVFPPLVGCLLGASGNSEDVKMQNADNP